MNNGIPGEYEPDCNTDVRVLVRYYNRVTDANEKAAKAILDKLFTSARKSRKASGGS